MCLCEAKQGENETSQPSQRASLVSIPRTPVSLSSSGPTESCSLLASHFNLSESCGLMWGGWNRRGACSSWWPSLGSEHRASGSSHRWENGLEDRHSTLLNMTRKMKGFSLFFSFFSECGWMCSNSLEFLRCLWIYCSRNELSSIRSLQMRFFFSSPSFSFFFLIFMTHEDGD